MTITLLLFWITFALFAGDVLLGKIGVLTSGAVHALLGEIPHFLLLALAAALLTAECLKREARRNASRTHMELHKNSISTALRND